MGHTMLGRRPATNHTWRNRYESVIDPLPGDRRATMRGDGARSRPPALVPRHRPLRRLPPRGGGAAPQAARGQPARAAPRGAAGRPAVLPPRAGRRAVALGERAVAELAEVIEVHDGALARLRARRADPAVRARDDRAPVDRVLPELLGVVRGQLGARPRLRMDRSKELVERVEAGDLDAAIVVAASRRARSSSARSSCAGGPARAGRRGRAPLPVPTRRLRPALWAARLRSPPGTDRDGGRR